MSKEHFGHHQSWTTDWSPRVTFVSHFGLAPQQGHSVRLSTGHLVGAAAFANGMPG